MMRRSDLSRLRIYLEGPLECTQYLEVPHESKFLLEFDLDGLCRSSFDTQQYWFAAAKAAVKAGQRRAQSGARARRIRENTIRRRTRRERLGIIDVERQIRQDGVHLLSSPLDEWRLAPLSTNTPSKRQAHPSLLQALHKSNKRRNHQCG